MELVCLVEHVILVPEHVAWIKDGKVRYSLKYFRGETGNIFAKIFLTKRKPEIFLILDAEVGPELFGAQLERVGVETGAATCHQRPLGELHVSALQHQDSGPDLHPGTSTSMKIKIRRVKMCMKNSFYAL